MALTGRQIQIGFKLGEMAAECEEEAAKLPESNWYAQFLRRVAVRYRAAQINLFDCIWGR